MARREYGEEWVGSDKLYAYNIMNRLAKRDGPLPTTRMPRAAAASEKKTKKTKPSAAWPQMPQRPRAEPFAPFAARALLGELSADALALALIPESTRFALIRVLASPVASKGTP
jgi:hypothetical protein